MAEQRNKEIGIRKVLGASVSGITAMLSKDFVKLVIISIIIASPIAWWAMTKWLQDFALSYFDQLVDGSCRRVICYCHCSVDDKFSVNKGCVNEPGKDIKGRVIGEWSMVSGE
jgi:hypothetical protein